ncbi:MAG: hypothetical protein LBR08_03505 [Bacteroidales bacterium]|jgi:hypothetical protein|nr:hypothetical protein [Bacteroidales bacterium]
MILFIVLYLIISHTIHPCKWRKTTGHAGNILFREMTKHLTGTEAHRRLQIPANPSSAEDHSLQVHGGDEH